MQLYNATLLGQSRLISFGLSLTHLSVFCSDSDKIPSRLDMKINQLNERIVNEKKQQQQNELRRETDWSVSVIVPG